MAMNLPVQYEAAAVEEAIKNHVSSLLLGDLAVLRADIETKLVQAVVGEAPATCFFVGPRDILGKLVGESEGSVCGYQNATRHRTPMRWKRMSTVHDQF